MAAHQVRAARIYDQPRPGDGARVLVDRLWPRGMTKEAASLREWCRDVAPSTELRQWYSHTPALFDEFAQRYREELALPEQAAGLARLRSLSRLETVTLLTSTKALDLSHAVVLAAIVGDAP